jgi:hypothetical protein
LEVEDDVDVVDVGVDEVGVEEAVTSGREYAVGEVGLRKHRPCPPTLETFGVHTVSVSQEDPSLHEH